MYGANNSKMVEVDRVFLDQWNPRHEPFNSQGEAVSYLCGNEKILTLAEDIVENGLNPLELFALIKERGNTYFSAEGNRRLCAIKLLNDPDLAPAKYREKFEILSKDYDPIGSIFAAEFKNREEVRLWLDRIHAGQDSGRGRRQWKAEQKSRNSVYSKNDFAMSLLDVAQNLKFITEEERKGRLSTVQRYLSNPLMRNSLGLVLSVGEDEYKVNLGTGDFKLVLSYFMDDLKSKRISTRANSKDITGYANKLTSLEDFTGERVLPTSLLDFMEQQEANSSKLSQASEQDQANSPVPSCSSPQPNSVRQPDPSSQPDTQDQADSSNKPIVPIQPDGVSDAAEPLDPEQKGPRSPQPPSRPNKLVYSRELQEKLKAIPSYKLDSMYYTLCTLFLSQHTPMLYVGVWSFVESLTALCGRSDNVDFQGYLSKERLSSLGITDKAEQKAIRHSLQRISEFGNSTKHHKDGAGFNSSQLANDFQVLQNLLFSLANLVAAGTTN